MSRVRRFFLREAGECLGEMAAAVDGEAMDVAAVYGAVRRLRGSAQMARFDGVARRAGVLERRLRPYVLEGSGRSRRAELEREAVGSGDADLRRVVRQALRSLSADVEAVREGRLEEDPRMEAGMEKPEERYGRDERDERDGAEVVPIETLEYRGEAALERALELRPAIEAVVASDATAGPVLDELFDLIRLGAK